MFSSLAAVATICCAGVDSWLHKQRFPAWPFTHHDLSPQRLEQYERTLPSCPASTSTSTSTRATRIARSCHRRPLHCDHKLTRRLVVAVLTQVDALPKVEALIVVR